MFFLLYLTWTKLYSKEENMKEWINNINEILKKGGACKRVLSGYS